MAAGNKNQEMLELRPSRTKWGVTALAGLGCLVFGGVALADGMDIGWAAVGLAVLILGSSVFQLLPGRGNLTLTPEGFEVKTPRGTLFYPWQAVGNFRTARFLLAQGVVYDITDPEKMPEQVKVTEKNIDAGGQLPDSYGMNPEDLAALMNNWQDRYGTQKKQSGKRKAKTRRGR